MEEMLAQGAREEILGIVYHPLLLSMDPTSSSMLNAEEEHLARALASKAKGCGAAINDGQVSTRAAREMVTFIAGEMQADIVLAAVRYTCLMLNAIFHCCSAFLGIWGDGRCYEPLLEKPLWRRRFLLGELDDGVPPEAQRAFRATLQHYRAVLDACPSVPPPAAGRRLIVCTDFDDTCTTADTTAVLLAAAAGAAAESWYRLMDSVCTDMERWLAVYEDCGDVHRCLEGLEAFEKRLDEQIVEQRLLRGVSREAIQNAAAERVRLHDCCGEALEELLGAGGELHIISSNWSRDLIRHSLPARIRDGGGTVHANDLSFDDAGICDGGIRLEIQDSFAKAGIVIKIRAEAEAAAAAASSPPKALIFVGDSINDLLALLEADVGIVLGENAMLQAVMAMHGVEVLPLPISAAQILAAGWSTNFQKSRKLFRASDWLEVRWFLRVVNFPPPNVNVKGQL